MCFRIACRLLSGLALILASGQLQASGQATPSDGAQLPQREQPADTQISRVGKQYTLRVTSREVVAEVVALDRHNLPVRDMKASDFEVFEVTRHKSLQKITAFHVVDPELEAERIEPPSDGFRITLGGRCAMRASFHYQLAYQPNSDGWTSGYHEVLVTTRRSDVRLSFHRRYYVGETYVAGKSPQPDRAGTDTALHQAACFQSATPPSISLAVRLIETASTDRLRYSLVVQAASLAFTSLTDEAQHVQLDYGICTFDAAGTPLRYMRTSAERVLTSEEYEKILAQGFEDLLEFSRLGGPAFVRFVVRDRETGNLGSTQVFIAPPAPVELTEEQSNAAGSVEKRQAETGDRNQFPGIAPGTRGSFGSILPQPGSMCGDVYELPAGSSRLPDFWSLDSNGALYTYSLNVPNHLIQNTAGIPGVLNRLDWFGIDYRGEFWVETGGQYTFALISDDGAKLYIDENLVIDEDGVHRALSHEFRMKLSSGKHTIHVPYFQGPLQFWALVLLVKAPGEQEFKVFDLRDFSRLDVKK